MRKPLLFILLSVFFVPLLTHGQGTLSGSVIDEESGEGLASARVVVMDGKSGGLTDEKGKFSFKVAKKPPFTLRVTYVSYDTLDYEVTSFDQPLKLEMAVSSLNITGLEIVGQSISEKEKENPLTVESMSSLAIKEVAGSDFYASLGNLKGVDLTSASLGFKVINTRGFNSTSPVRSLQIIDGVDNQSPGLNFSLGNFLGASEIDVQKIDLVVGASSAFYGPNAFNGVISMNTKSPFVHPGLTVNAKIGERNMLEGAIRYAKVFKNKDEQDKLGIKVNLFFLRADDWEATNLEPTPQSLAGLNNPGGYDAVNRYGDENQTNGANNASGLSGQSQTPGLGVWYRDGYEEKDVVDYDTRNLKASAALHYKIREDVELIGSSNFGTGTTVYQGDNRYSLKDIRFFQHRLELKQKDRGFIRAYATHENAGNSYDAVFTAFMIQDVAKSDFDWSRDYRNYYQINVVPKVRNLPGMPAFSFPYDYDRADSVMAVYNDSLVKWHQDARQVANAENQLFGDAARYEPGTAAFDSLLADVTSKTSFTEGGTRLYDRSALYHVHGEYKFTPGFMDIIVGGNTRLYTPQSEGSIFSDTNGVRITNFEYGFYVGLEKWFWDKKLKVNATNRVDKNQNFNFLFSPAVSAVYKPNENNILRFSFSSAIRNPTLTEQYLYYNVGRAILLGNVNGIDSLVSLPSLNDFFNTQNYDTLGWFDIPPIRPEKVKTLEVGYRGTLWEKLYVDAGYYFSFYRDFIGFKIGADIDYDPFFNRAQVNKIYRVAANATEVVTTQGFALGLNYYFKKYYSVSGNYSWNKLDLQGSDNPIIPAFNTPEHKFNIGLSGRNITTKFGEKTLRDWGFNFTFKWVQGFEFQGSPQFTGYVPTYSLLDGQLNKHVSKIHTTFKIGSSNILSRKQLQVYGGPFVGRLAYFSVLVDLDNI